MGRRRSRATRRSPAGCAAPPPRRACARCGNCSSPPAWIDANPLAAARFTPTGTPAARRAHHAASTGHDASALLPAITAPTLVLHGGDDALTPVGNAAVLAAGIPGARLVVLPGARHGYLEEFRAEASALVAGFLA